MDSPNISTDDVRSQVCKELTASKLQSIPLETRHMVFSYLVQPASIINILDTIIPYKVADSLTPIALTCKNMRKDVLAWYEGNKSKLNLTKTKKFGQVNLETLKFELHVGRYLADMRGKNVQLVHTAFNEIDVCPHDGFCLEVLLATVRRWTWADLQLIRFLKVSLIAEDRLRLRTGYNLCALKIIQKSMLSLEELDVILYWSVSKTTRDHSWHELKYLNTPSPCIPTSKGNRLTLYNQDASCKPKVTLWFSWSQRSLFDDREAPRTPERLRVWPKGGGTPEIFDVKFEHLLV